MARVAKFVEVGFSPNQAKTLASLSFLGANQAYAGALAFNAGNVNFQTIPNFSINITAKAGDLVELSTSINNSGTALAGRNEISFFRDGIQIGLILVEETKLADLNTSGLFDVSSLFIIDVAPQGNINYSVRVRRLGAGDGIVARGVFAIRHFEGGEPL